MVVANITLNIFLNLGMVAVLSIF